MQLQDWRQSTNRNVQFRKSKMIDSLTLDQPLLVALSKMQDNSLNFIALVSKERTQLYGCIHNTDLLQFITTHWQSDTSVFLEPISNLNLFQNEIVRCKENNSVFHVLRKMRDFRISVVPVDSQDGEFTVGLCFLTDLIYLFRQPEFYKFFSLSIIEFIKMVNYFD